MKTKTNIKTASPMSAGRLKVLLYYALEYIEEMTNESIMGSDTEDALGITWDEYDEIMGGQR